MKFMKIGFWLGFALIFLMYAFVYFGIVWPKNVGDNSAAMSRLDALVSCTNGGFVLPGLAVACEQTLTRLEFSPGEIDFLNVSGGIGILAESNKDLAQKMLPRLISKGVDINLPVATNNVREKQWTTLHHAVFYPPWWTELLLKNNADSHRVDAYGQTPLDLAKELVKKKPSNSDWVVIVRLLEQNEKRP